ncbi:hypothetical protein [Salmonella bongori]|uniref:hypothetical protein n=1 Tax=Salmonella bongori TaxID=54736 RepID=UPI0015C569DA|nr:hypothetical protein [Salmonella bongori]
MSKNYDIKWRVTQSVCIDEGYYLLTLDSRLLKIMAMVLSTHPVNATDILSPIGGGHYVINYTTTKLVKIISTTELNSTEWKALAL